MPKNAYVMLMMHADGYLPGVLVAAFSLIKTQTTADIVIMVTPDVSQEARQQIDTLNTEKNKVIIWPVPYIQYASKPLKSARVRELYPWIKTSYTKWNALTLSYDKVILLDADMLVIKKY
jgi:alpha-N-acetylglucosamine transferase